MTTSAIVAHVVFADALVRGLVHVAADGRRSGQGQVQAGRGLRELLHGLLEPFDGDPGRLRQVGAVDRDDRQDRLPRVGGRAEQPGADDRRLVPVDPPDPQLRVVLAEPVQGRHQAGDVVAVGRGQGPVSPLGHHHGLRARRIMREPAVEQVLPDHAGIFRREEVDVVVAADRLPRRRELDQSGGRGHPEQDDDPAPADDHVGESFEQHRRLRIRWARIVRVRRDGGAPFLTRGDSVGSADRVGLARSPHHGAWGRAVSKPIAGPDVAGLAAIRRCLGRRRGEGALPRPVEYP